MKKPLNPQKLLIMVLAFAFGLLITGLVGAEAAISCPDWPDTEGYDTILNSEFEMVSFPDTISPPLGTITVSGSVIIWRGPYDDVGGSMPTEMLELSASGTSPLLGGDFQITLNPDSVCYGEIRPCSTSCIYADSWFLVSYVITTTQAWPLSVIRGTALMQLQPDCSGGGGWNPMRHGGQRFWPGGFTYQDPRKTPIIDDNGDTVGYQWHKHKLPDSCLCCDIGCIHNAGQGINHRVPVTLSIGDKPIGGYDLMIAYDASALALQSAIPGPAFYDPAPDGCGWEYFTYRHGPFGNCGDACPSGMVRVFGLAETNNGPNHPSCFLPDSLPAEFFSLDFLVSNDRTLECMNVPIHFYWTDCGDNSISSMDGELLFVSDHIYEFEGTEITDPTFGFPTYFGVQSGCLNPDPDKPTVERFVNFTNGCINIVCADSIDDRGDINLNGVVNEVADAVLYSNYFVHGISVFNVNIDGQIAASDVNADGITLSVADLVYMVRIITGDAPPYPKLTPVAANAELVNGVLSVDSDMGAAYVVVERSITPKLLAESMGMKYQYDADHDLTRILVYSMDKDRRFAGDFIGGIDGNVITLEMATYEGTPVTTKLVPDRFALYPSYPNPFNPVTTISFALASLVDYELVIYNSLGQTVKTFNGHSGPGLERIDWNASGFASGVYFYRLTAGDFTDTKKMVLLK